MPMNKDTLYFLVQITNKDEYISFFLEKENRIASHSPSKNQYNKTDITQINLHSLCSQVTLRC